MFKRAVPDANGQDESLIGRKEMLKAFAASADKLPEEGPVVRFFRGQRVKRVGSDAVYIIRTVLDSSAVISPVGAVCVFTTQERFEVLRNAD